MNWYFYAIFATVLYGLINFLYKAAAVYKCPARLILNRAAITVATCSIVGVIVTKSPFSYGRLILILALVNSTFFAMGNMSKMKSLIYLPTSISLPVCKLNAVFVILISCIVLGDRPRPFQWIGIFLSIVLLYVASSGKKDNTEIKKKGIGILFALGAASSTSISIFAGKMAATSVPILNYMTISYIFVACFTWLINHFDSLPAEDIDMPRINKYGFLIGIFNFTGHYALLKAYETGPLTLCQGIFVNSFIISIILSMIVFKEKMTLRSGIIIILAICAVLMIKIS